MNDNNKRGRLVVIGGGFAGLNFLKHLKREQWQDVVLIDKNNYNSFPPLFYQVASAGLDAGSISFALRREMRSRHMRGVRYHLGEVLSIDTESKVVKTQFEEIAFDTLVVAPGTTNNFFGMADLEKKVFTLKSTVEALRTRNEILFRLERAAVCDDPEVRRKLLTFTIIGGGPAGVEIAGALGELKRYILKREYPGISPEEVTVTLVEGSDRLLGAMTTRASQKVLEYMNHLMVNVRLNTMMESYEDGTLHFKDGSDLYSEVVIWSAGVAGVPFDWKGVVPQKAPGGRIAVDEYNKVQGCEDVYALGDLAYHADNKWPRGLPQVAQVAIQGGVNLARNLNKGRFDNPFVYKDKGTMATVGRNRAVVDLHHMHMYGRPAWFAWMLIHLMSLLGMRNKLTVLITWVWAYFTYSASLRLLIKPSRYPLRDKWNYD